MIESAALAARIQGSKLFPECSVPEGPSLWAEAMNWVCDAYNRTATVANPRSRMKCSTEILHRRVLFLSSSPDYVI